MTAPAAETVDRPAYRRLPGRSQPYMGLVWIVEVVLTYGLLAIVPRPRLYHGDDHLLLLHRSFFTEMARRYYFRDIQAITIQRTRLGATVNAALALLTACCLLPVILAGILPPPSEAAVVFSAIAAGVFALVLALNVLLGPTCQTTIHTAVSRSPLPNLARWRTALRVAGNLRGTIEAAQEPVDAAQDAPLVSAQYATPAARQQERARHHENGHWHLATFGLSLLLGLSAIADFAGNWMVKNAFDMLMLTGLLLCGCVAVMRQQRSDLGPEIRFLTGLLLGLSIMAFYIAQILGSILVAMNPEMAMNPAEAWGEHELRFYFISLMVIIHGVPGIIGLVLLIFFRRRPAGR